MFLNNECKNVISFGLMVEWKIFMTSCMLLMCFGGYATNLQMPQSDCITFGIAIVTEWTSKPVPVGGFDVQVDLLGTTDIANIKLNQSHWVGKISGKT